MVKPILLYLLWELSFNKVYENTNAQPFGENLKIQILWSMMNFNSNFRTPWLVLIVDPVKHFFGLLFRNFKFRTLKGPKVLVSKFERSEILSFGPFKVRNSECRTFRKLQLSKF